MKILTLNVANINRSKTRALQVAELLSSHNVDIAILTEVELAPEEDLTLPGYQTFAPATPGKGARIVTLIKLNLATKTTLIKTSKSDVWISLQTASGPLAVGGVYRQWGSNSGEYRDLEEIHSSCRMVTSSHRRVVSIGDYNLDIARKSDSSYQKKSMLVHHSREMDLAGLHLIGPSEFTYYSYGKFGPDNVTRKSILDHCYASDAVDMVSISVLDSSMTDHRPVLLQVRTELQKGSLKTISRRKLKGLSVADVCNALEDTNWHSLYALSDPDTVLDAIVTNITRALDRIAPVKEITVKRGRPDLYLQEDTRAAMAMRDMAAKTANSPDSNYRQLRNITSKLVRRDKFTSNLASLQKAKSDPKQVWRMANEALGKSKTSLPDHLISPTGKTVSDGDDLADLVNTYFVEKVSKLRAGIDARRLASARPPLQCSVPQPPSVLTLKYPNAAKVSKAIDSLSDTGATGVDGIPTKVLKLGRDVLAGPIAYLIQRSLATSKVPAQFKMANVIPVHKGKGKSLQAPSSFRPVAILPALSKVMELVVMWDLRPHLEKVLPASQYGFRPGRSTTAAVATAHGHWMRSVSAGETVAVLAADLSSAFDTVDKDLLLSKLTALGIRGRANSWFADYMSGRKQRVIWEGHPSSYRNLEYGVPQGSIIGPALFLALIADMPSALRVAHDDVISSDGSGTIGLLGYADDSTAWTAGRDPNDVALRLELAASRLVTYCDQTGLAINPEKTQVLWSTGSRPIVVDNVTVEGSSQMELLGMTLGKKLEFKPHLAKLVRDTKKVGFMINRLSHHLPPGPYLKQLATGLLNGKVAYAAGAVGHGKLNDDATIVDAGIHADVQVAINAAARSVLGVRKTDKISTKALLQKSKLPSFNQTIVRSTLMETWKAVKGNNEPARRLIYGHHNSQTNRNTYTRAKQSGIIAAPTCFPARTFVCGPLEHVPCPVTGPNAVRGKGVCTDRGLTGASVVGILCDS